MRRLFDSNRPGPQEVRRIKALIMERFGLPGSAALAVAELRGHEPDCSPIETAITVRKSNACAQSWRVAKTITDIDHADIELPEPPATNLPHYSCRGY